mgnify:CR=1 FL=1
MKKNLLSLISVAFLAIGYSSQASAEIVPVPLQVTDIDPTTVKEGQQRTPDLTPELSMDGHILYFDTPCDGCLLRIIDEDNYVVYSVVIPVGATMHVLPTYLSGDYEIQIIRDNLCFYGYIEL